jgi:uncharacterized membrane protein HdeD (DUF308 family)
MKMKIEENIQQSSGLIIIAGILLLLLGMLSIGSPLVAGLSSIMIIGLVLTCGGLSQLFFAFKSGKGIFAIILGVLTVSIGGYLVSHPLAALGSLTLYLAVYMIISGAFEVLMSLQLRAINGWVWAAFSGIVSVLCGIMIWMQFPLSGVWAVGILIGVRLFSNGLTLLILGLASRR